MKKISLLLLLITLIPNVAFAAFLDVAKSSKYATAIDYLASKKIIQGYGNNIFKPQKLVNRAEFLKISMLASNVILDAKEKTNFTDVNEKSWYGPYIQKAVKEGWVQGYENGKFRPEQTVNKVEALKMLSKIQNWNITERVSEPPYNDTPMYEWYAPYVLYAKNKKIIENGKKFYPSASLNRGQVAQLIYKSIVPPGTVQPGNTEFPTEKPAPAPKPTLQEEGSLSAKIMSEESIPLPDPPPGTTKFFMIESNLFDQINLKEEFPTNFYKDEIYIFRGTTTAKEGEKITAFLNYKDANDKSYFIDFTARTSGNEFAIPVTFSQKGKYNLGIIAGSGTTKIVEISVDDLPQPENNYAGTPAKAFNIQLAHTKDTTTLSWDKVDAKIHRIIFEQNEKKKTYYYRQQNTSIPLLRRDFQNFQEGSMKITIDGAQSGGNFPLIHNGMWNSSDTKTVEVTTHIQKSGGNADIPEILQEPKTITFSGTAKENIQQKAAIRKPNGFVDEIALKSEKTANYFKIPIIPIGNTYQFTYTPATTGSYQIEVNNEGGSAIINTPAYIGKAIPLLPDFFEINENTQKTDLAINLNPMREKMLDAVNYIRKIHNLQPVKLRDDLNTLAQMHTDDMAKRDFFGHVNPDGKTPQDRRKTLKIPAAVGENLANSPTLMYGLHGLLNSPIHRKNILDPKWNSLGLGFAKDGKGSLLIAQEFSTNALTATDLEQLKTEIMSTVNNERQNRKLNSLTKDENATEIAALWSDKLLTMDKLSFEAPDGTSLSSLLKQKNIQREVSIFLFDTNTAENFADYIINNSTILSEKWNAAGIGISVTTLGDLKLTIIVLK